MKYLTFIICVISGLYATPITAQNAKLHVEGSFATTVTTTSTDLTLDDSHQVILVNSALQRTITLPSAVGIAGRQYTIKRTGMATVNIIKQSGDTIDGMNISLLLLGTNAFITLISDGNNWWIIGRG